MKTCLKCQNTHEKPGTYCSKSCSNSRPKSLETRRKQSELAKANPRGCATWEHERDKKWCKRCNEQFEAQPHSKKQFCSHYCSQKGKNKENTGGYRPGSGRAKSGHYKGIYCGSTWELAWLIYQIDHGYDFSRFEEALVYNGIKYVPDFLQNGDIIEIKGFESQESVNKKNEVAEHYGYKVIVKRENDLQKEFEWMRTNYLYENWHTLYDGHRPKFQYTCDHCGSIFNSERKRKVNRAIYCSRECAGKGNRS